MHTQAPQEAAFATATNHLQSPVRGPFRRAAGVAGDLFGAVALVLCVPFVLIAIGAPIALAVRLLLWIGGMF